MSGAFDDDAAERLDKALRQALLDATVNGVNIGFDNVIKIAEARWQTLYTSFAPKNQLDEAGWFLGMMKDAKRMFVLAAPHIPEMEVEEESTIPPPPEKIQ